MTKDQFITTMGGLINSYCNSRHLPVHIADLALCQACLESGFGSSSVMMNNNAPFGIKATGNKPYYEVTTKEYMNGRYITVKARFCKYNTLAESVIDYFKLLNWSRYAPVMNSKNFEDATEQIRLCGYATSPVYTDSLRRIYNEIKTYKPNNYNYIVATQKDPLNVRERPDINSKILTSLSKDTKIYINTEWSYVPAYNGFVFNKYIKGVDNAGSDNGN